MKRSPSKSRVKPGLLKPAAAVAAGVVAGLLVVVPLPYYVLEPGRAIELGTRVAVQGSTASHARLYLTDVAVRRATSLGLLLCFLPATEIVGVASVVPAGQSSEAFDRTMTDAMTESQNVAGFVAERAAGYRVADDFIVRIEGFSVNSAASGVLEKGDRVLAVAGRAIHGTLDVKNALSRARNSRTFAVTYERAGETHVADVAPTIVAGTPRLGVFLSSRLPVVDLPVPVRFSMDDVAGASGGLMFALQIYADLRSLHVGPRVAGTGTLAPDGTVGPIEGTRQKFEAARRAGATVFLVPAQNLHDLDGVRADGIAIVFVKSFRDALAYVTRAKAREN